LALTVFTQRNFVADFLQAKCSFFGKSAILFMCDSVIDIQTINVQKQNVQGHNVNLSL